MKNKTLLILTSIFMLIGLITIMIDAAKFRNLGSLGIQGEQIPTGWALVAIGIIIQIIDRLPQILKAFKGRK